MFISIQINYIIKEILRLKSTPEQCNHPVKLFEATKKGEKDRDRQRVRKRED